MLGEAAEIVCQVRIALGSTLVHALFLSKMCKPPRLADKRIVCINHPRSFCGYFERGSRARTCRGKEHQVVPRQRQEALDVPNGKIEQVQRLCGRFVLPVTSNGFPRL